MANSQRDKNAGGLAGSEGKGGKAGKSTLVCRAMKGAPRADTGGSRAALLMLAADSEQIIREGLFRLNQIATTCAICMAALGAG